MTFPVVDREPVRLPTLAGHDDELWDALIELSEVRPGEWTLIGGQMVFLHAIEQGAIPPRLSTDSSAPRMAQRRWGAIEPASTHRIPLMEVLEIVGSDSSKS